MHYFIHLNEHFDLFIDVVCNFKGKAVNVSANTN